MQYASLVRGDRGERRSERRVCAFFAREQMRLGSQAKRLFEHVVAVEVRAANRGFVKIGEGRFVLRLLKGNSAELQEGDAR